MEERGSDKNGFTSPKKQTCTMAEIFCSLFGRIENAKIFL